MNTSLIVAGPVVLVLMATYLIGTGIIYFGDVDGLEIEQESIEYRDGAEQTTTRRQPGILQYINIHVRRPVGFENWLPVFKDQVAREDCENCNPQLEQNEQSAEVGEMIEIDPPTLVIPAR